MIKEVLKPPNEPGFHDSTAPVPAAAIPRFGMDCDGLLAIPYLQAQTNPGLHILLLVLQVQLALFRERGLLAEVVSCAKGRNWQKIFFKWERLEV